MTAGRLAALERMASAPSCCQDPVELGGDPMGARGGENAAPLPPGSATIVGNLITNLVP